MSITIESKTCHNGGSKGSLAGIRIGENNGNIDPYTANDPFGLFNTGNTNEMAIITGIKIGIISCCPSPRSSPIADPTAAKRDE
jgi:hypothetical protein